jgi:hypothetical protein
MCERCGSHCFCAAVLGLLPKSRSAAAIANSAQQQMVEEDLAASQDVQAVAAPQDELQFGIAAFLEYDSE